VGTVAGIGPQGWLDYISWTAAQQYRKSVAQKYRWNVTQKFRWNLAE
jgi:hypothetical protein